MVGHLLYELPWNNNIDVIDVRASTFKMQQHFLDVARNEHMCLKQMKNNYATNEQKIARIVIGIEMLNGIENFSDDESGGGVGDDDVAAVVIFAIPLSSSDDNYIKSK